MSTIILALGTFVARAVIFNMAKEVTDVTEIVMILLVRVISRIEVLVFQISEGPLQCSLIIEEYSLLLGEAIEIFLSTRLIRNLGRSLRSCKGDRKVNAMSDKLAGDPKCV